MTTKTVDEQRFIEARGKDRINHQSAISGFEQLDPLFDPSDD